MKSYNKMLRVLLLALCFFSCNTAVYSVAVQHNPQISAGDGTPFNILIDEFAATIDSGGDYVGKDSTVALEVIPDTTPDPNATTQTYEVEVKFGAGPIAAADWDNSKHFTLRTEPSGHENEAYQYLEWEIEDAAGGTRREDTNAGVMTFDLTPSDFEDTDGASGGTVTITLIGKYANGGEDEVFTNFQFEVVEGCSACASGTCSAGSSSASLSAGGMNHSFNLGSSINGSQKGSIKIKGEALGRQYYEPSSLLVGAGDGFEIIYDHRIEDEVIIPNDGGQGVDPGDGNIGGGNTGGGQEPEADSPSITYKDLSNLPEGNYTLWAYVHAPSSESNSLYVAVDESLNFHWNLGVGDDYRWVPFNSSILNGLDGDHRLYVKYGEAGISIRKFILTPNSSYVPSDPDADPDDGVSQVLEPVFFSGRSDIFVNHPDGSGGVLIVDRPFTFPTHPIDDTSMLVANLGIPGTASMYNTSHYVWVRLKAPDYASNKLLINMEDYDDLYGQEEYNFVSIDPSDSWQWVLVGTKHSDYYEYPRYSIAFWTIDSGVLFDRLVITGDEQFNPTDSNSQPSTSVYMAEFEDHGQDGTLFHVNNMNIRTDSQASGAEYLEDRETNLVYNPLENEVESYFAIVAPVAADYNLLVRMRAEAEGENRVSVRVGDTSSPVVAAPSNEWQWVSMAADSISLEEGSNRLTLDYADSGVQVDQMVLSTNLTASMPPYPASLDPNSFDPTYNWCRTDEFFNYSGTTGTTQPQLKTISFVRQILSRDALMDVVESDTDAKSYTINFYYYEDRGNKDSDGYYVPVASPYRSYTISDPDGEGNRLLITDNSGVDYEYRWIDNEWALLEGGIRERRQAESWSADRTLKTVIDQTLDNQGNLFSETTSIYKQYDFDLELFQRVNNPSGIALTTEWGYYENSIIPGESVGGHAGALKYRKDPNGYWEVYEYDNERRRSKTIRQYLNAEFGDEANAYVTVYSYEDVSGLGNVVYFSQEVETLGSAELSRSYYIRRKASGVDETWRIECQTPGANWNASDNLVTITKRIPEGAPYAGQTQSVERPDGKMTLYNYEALNESGVVDNQNYITIQTTIETGVPDAAKTSITKGTRSVSLLDVDTSVTTSTKRYDIESGQLTAASDVVETDTFNRVLQRVYLDGTVETWDYNCCSLDYHTDRQGIVTAYTYDGLDRRETTTRLGVTTKTVYDVSGRVLQQMRKAEGEPDSSYVVLSESDYNLAGQRTHSRQLASDGTLPETSYTYEYYPQTVGAPGMATTVTYPNTGTEVSIQYGDGKPVEVSGTAVTAPVRYTYTVDPATNSVKTRRTPLEANGSMTTEWSESQQVMGRSKKTVYADSSFSENFYDDEGRLIQTIDPDGVTMLYAYNDEGERYRSAVDMDQDGLISTTSDRVTETERMVTTREYKGSTFNVQRRISKVWTDTGLVTTSINDRSLDGRRSWSERFGQIAYTETTDADATDGAWSVKSIRPDKSYTVQTYTNGRLSGTASYDADDVQLASNTITYDDLSRQQNIIDSRTGTTTLTYYDNDALASTIAPDPDGDTSAGQGGVIQHANGDGVHSPLETTYFYNHMGRQIRILLPDTTSTHTEYNFKSQVVKTYGAQQNPVEYSYDYSGRQKTMKTWQDFDGINGVGVSGSAVTTWIYNPLRGWLDRKEYNDGNGTDYTYTPGGRLASRTWARGVVTNYGYNSAGDLLAVDYIDAGVTPDIHYTYTRTGQQDIVSEGQFAGAAFTAGEIFTPSLSPSLATTYHSTDYEMNDHFQIEKEKRSGLFGDDDAVLTRSYEDGTETNGLVGRAKGYSLNIGVQTPVLAATYGYDPGGRVETVTDGTDTFTYGYEPNTTNLLASVTGPVHTVYYSYEPGRNAMTGIENKETVGTDSVVSDYAYTYNAIGQRRTRKQSYDDATSVHTDTFEYDYLGQIDYVENDVYDGVAKYEPNYNFDEIGNRNGNTSNLDGTVNYVPNLLNQYNSVDSVSYTYDLDGNLTNDGTWSYTWNAENRLIEMETLPAAYNAGAPRKILYFTYDYMGRRIFKLVDRWDTRTSTYFPDSWDAYLYDGWNLIAEFDSLGGSSVPQRTYQWGLDLSGSIQGAGGVGGLLSLTHSGGSTYFPTYDANGNITGYHGDTGDSVAKFEYGPFGELITATGSMSDDFNFHFSTKYEDDETDLLYYGFRYYDPVTGRWPSRDPIEETGGLNLYAMVGNNAVNQWDKLGMFARAHKCRGKKEDIVEAEQTAKRRASNTVSIIGSDYSSFDTALARAGFTLSPQQIARAKLLFDTWKTGTLSNLNATIGGLESNDYDVDCCAYLGCLLFGNPQAYVVGDNREINLCSGFFSSSSNEKSSTIFHELSHIYADTNDDVDDYINSAHILDDYIENADPRGSLSNAFRGAVIVPAL